MIFRPVMRTEMLDKTFWGWLRHKLTRSLTRASDIGRHPVLETVSFQRQFSTAVDRSRIWSRQVCNFDVSSVNSRVQRTLFDTLGMLRKINPQASTWRESRWRPCVPRFGTHSIPIIATIPTIPIVPGFLAGVLWSHGMPRPGNWSWLPSATVSSPSAVHCNS